MKIQHEYVQREDILFINELIEIMNKFIHDNKIIMSTAKNPAIERAVECIRSLTRFIYISLGVDIANMKELAYGVSPFKRQMSNLRMRLLPTANNLPIYLKTFSAYPGNPDSEWTLACPQVDVQCTHISIGKKFAELAPKSTIYYHRGFNLLVPQVSDAPYNKISQTIEAYSLAVFRRLMRFPYGNLVDCTGSYVLSGDIVQKNIIPYLDDRSVASLSACSRGLFSASHNRVLLHYVVRGNLKKVKQILDANSGLVNTIGCITDLSDRTFTNITAFQYPAWALDEPMWVLLLRYLSKDDAARQLHILENERPDITKRYGAHFCLEKEFSKFINDLFLAGESLQTIHNWNIEKWCKEKGGRKLPAWLVFNCCGMYAGYGEVDRDSRYLLWWYDCIYPVGNAQGNFAVSPRWASLSTRSLLVAVSVEEEMERNEDQKDNWLPQSLRKRLLSSGYLYKPFREMSPLFADAHYKFNRLRLSLAAQENSLQMLGYSDDDDSDVTCLEL